MLSGRSVFTRRTFLIDKWNENEHLRKHIIKHRQLICGAHDYWFSLYSCLVHNVADAPTTEIFSLEGTIANVEPTQL
jgi:hypothetical protein